ncbi:MAG: hypothetical protein IJA18_06055, partial [Ruminococcus sp.]|nr:hypothetical protein [Ruminococcus sp.]
GPISMLGLDSDYTIDVSKIDADSKTPLNGATFGLFPVENGTVAETPSTTFTIEEGGKINQPIVPGRYALKEIKAPKGYELNEDKVYYIEVTEGREETKDDIWTGGYVEDIEPVLYILDENLTQEELTANADRYVPAEKEKTVYTYKFEYNNDLGQMAWGAQNPPTGVKIDSMTLHYPGSSPTADVYTIGENGFEQPADNTVYVPAEGTKKYYTYTLDFDANGKGLGQLALASLPDNSTVIEELTLVYADGSSLTDTDVSTNFANENWIEITNIDLNKENVKQIIFKTNTDLASKNADVVAKGNDNSELKKKFSELSVQSEDAPCQDYYKLYDETASTAAGKVALDVTVEGTTYTVEAEPPAEGTSRESVTISDVAWSSGEHWSPINISGFTDEDKKGVAEIELVLSGDVEAQEANMLLTVQKPDGNGYKNVLEKLPITVADCEKTVIPPSKYYKTYIDGVSPSGAVNQRPGMPGMPGGYPGYEPVGDYYDSAEVNGVLVEAIRTKANEYLPSFTYNKDVTIKVFNDAGFTGTPVSEAKYSPVNPSHATYAIDGNEVKLTVEIPMGEWFPRVTKIEGGDYDTADFTVYNLVYGSAPEYIITYKGSILDPKINLTQDFENGFEFGNTPKYKTVVISKIGGDGLLLDGATLELSSSDVPGFEAVEWITDEKTNPKTFELKVGTYTLTEKIAPEGYEVANPYTFEVVDPDYLTGDELPKYEKPYTIENILSDYSIFIRGDVWRTPTGSGLSGEKVSLQHIVGAIAVGGEAYIGAFADASTEHSYVEKLGIIEGANFNNKEYHIYYGSLVEGSSIPGGEETSKYVQNPGYINFDTAFALINSQAANIAASGTNITSTGELDKVEEFDGTVLNINVSDYPSKNIVIPYSVLKEIADEQEIKKTFDVTINLVDDSYDTSNDEAVKAAAKEFSQAGYKISITGMGNENASFYFSNSSADIPVENAIDIGVQYNGKSLYSQFASVNNGDLNDKGMNLIWNFPDATGQMRVGSGIGHMIAPNA